MTFTVQRRSGFSTLLRLALLLVFCFVFLECEAAPGTIELDGTKAYEFPSKEKLLEHDPKSRQKRAAVAGITIVMPRAAIPGIADSRIEADNTSLPFKDGQLCWNGQQPFNEEEATAFFKFLKDSGTIPEGKFVVPGSPPKAEVWIENCNSKKCSFDPKTASYICGNPTEKVFPDGKLCYDGRDPPSEKADSRYAADEKTKKTNDELNESLKKFCITNICKTHQHGDRGYPVCSSSSIQPILIILATLLGLSVFRNQP